jgi:putative Ca2+/H+ antiporter (TMEM165/GDT1 family)
VEAFLLSTGLVALAEIGDKTQLLSFVLAARYRRPLPIILGILVATLANHGLAAYLGHLIASLLGPEALQWILGLGFIAMAAWILIPDKEEEFAAEDNQAATFWKIFNLTLVLFFLAEMGDKTQIATIALAAELQSVVWVIMGTTLGMMVANVPAVLVGEKLATRLSGNVFRRLAALGFLLTGLAILLYN